MDNKEKIIHSLDIIAGYSQIDGAHHKAWVIDQVTQILTGENYESFIKEHNYGEDGPNTYSWDKGVAP